MADIGKEVALHLIQAADLIEQLLPLLVLSGDLGFDALLLRDIPAFRKEKHDRAVLVLDGYERIIDDDRLLAGGVTVNLDVAADELALACSSHEIALEVLSPFGDGPPASLPERLPLDVLELNTSALECGPVDFERRPVRVQQADELVHLVQHDAGKLLPVRLEIIGPGERDIANAKSWRMSKCAHRE
ncbi:MAG TPA: hypothetical protein VN876_06600 [Gemmatimonadaceae bacterium]|nr:hypothetical protein [Gemmatimonadaceae bacterium]